MLSFERFLGLGESGSNFSIQLRCFSAPFFQKYDTQKINELNYGGKILLPNSCLDNLVRRNIQWPMLFKLTNIDPEHQKFIHAGVLEFLAEEGKCYLPSWMMNQLQLMEGDIILVEYRSLPPATYAKFKPMSTDFYHVSNPKAMLEVELRKFACLTKGDVIAVQYNEQVFEFKVMELKPKNAVTIIECDINIEFDAAEGYTEPSRDDKKHSTKMGKGADMDVTENKEALDKGKTGVDGWEAFSGAGQRLDGKKISSTNVTSANQSKSATGKQSMSTSVKGDPTSGADVSATAAPSLTPIVVDEQYKPGELCFVRTDYKNRAMLEKMAREEANGGNNGSGGGDMPFMGKGQTIRGPV